MTLNTNLLRQPRESDSHLSRTAPTNPQSITSLIPEWRETVEKMRTNNMGSMECDKSITRLTRASSDGSVDSAGRIPATADLILLLHRIEIKSATSIGLKVHNWPNEPSSTHGEKENESGRLNAKIRAGGLRTNLFIRGISILMRLLFWKCGSRELLQKNMQFVFNFSGC